MKKAKITFTPRQPKRPWDEMLVRLGAVTALVLDGPGSEWLLLLRGARTQPPRAVGQKVKGRRS